MAVEPEITPAATDEEAAAIITAMHVLWPTPTIVTEEERTRDTLWKFSGRWWSRPLPQRRDRPYR